DRHHGVLRSAAPDGVAMPCHAVGAVAIPAQAHRGERLAEFAGVDVVESPPGPGQLWMRRLFDSEVVEAHQPGDVEYAVVHLPAFCAPGNALEEFAEHRVGAGQPSGADVDPGSVTQRPALVALEQRLLYLTRHGNDS